MATRSDFASQTLNRVTTKMAAVVARNIGTIPYTTDASGHYLDRYATDPSWWTNGFWGGLLWQLYTLTEDSRYREEALRVEAKLDPNLQTASQLNHDNGFKWLLTAVAHYRDDQDAAAKNRGLLAASNLLGRFNLAGRFLRAWDDLPDTDRSGWAIIDCMMNLPLLYWASAVQHDSRFAQVAYVHAKTAQTYAVRADGSVKHIICFDPDSGQYLHSLAGQGYAHGSTWSRGQAWGIYGFALSYQYTKDASLLHTAEIMADYFVAQMPDDCRIPIDFAQPKTPQLEDQSAAAIAASGLLEVAKYTGKPQYREAAVQLLQRLAADADWSQEHDAILPRCSAMYHEPTHEYPIIYGDYFFIEALMKLNENALMLW